MIGNAIRSVGRSHSNDEVPVMGMERRTSVIQSKYFKTTIKINGRIVKENDKVIAY
jgi:hypothetical protein